MNRLILNSTSVAQWYSLVNEAEDLFGSHLSSDLESYLVFLLQRYTNKPEIANSIMALDYLESLEMSGQLRVDRLRDVGDKCLLFSGFFPERADKRHVTVSYFVELGRRAYNYLSALHRQGLLTSKLYSALREQFVNLLDLLFFMRELSGEKSSLTLIQAEELWRNTGSKYALGILHKHNKNMIATKTNPFSQIH